jgi:Zn-dependent M28 family amino/carboxypeptidase
VEVFNGANDNASGVAALLQLAKYYTVMGRRKIDFICSLCGRGVGIAWFKNLVKQVLTEMLCVW